MITDILKSQLSELLGNLSIFYSSSKILTSIKNQIDNLTGKIDIELLNNYQKDYQYLLTENKELDTDINDIINNSGKISDIINKVSSFNLSIDYIKSLGDDYSIIEKYSTLIPKTISKLKTHIENLETLQLAILNQTGQYSLKLPMTTTQKVLIAGVIVTLLYGVFKYVKR